MNISVLQNYKYTNEHPYPYIVIEDALPEKAYSELEKTFPESQVLSTPVADFGFTYRYKCNPVLIEKKISNIWIEFFEYHTSKEYFQECLKVFEKFMNEETYKFFTNNDVGVRNVNNNGQFVTDCQFVVHNPLSENETTRTPHLDNPIEIYAGLLYMKKDSDKSSGGNFTIYEAQNPISINQSREVLSDIKNRIEVPYKKNCFVMFLNVNNSVHGVTPRINAKETRRSINIIGEFNPSSKQRMW